jgi:hypothetical protein
VFKAPPAPPPSAGWTMWGSAFGARAESDNSDLSPIFPRRVGDLLRRLAQYRAERRNAQARRATVARDKRLDQSLAFAGRSE